MVKHSIEVTSSCYQCKIEMNNCLIDQIIGDILWQCGCKPSFYENFEGIENLTTKEQRNVTCSGKRLDCAIERMKSMDPEKLKVKAWTDGKETSVNEQGETKVINITKPSGYEDGFDPWHIASRNCNKESTRKLFLDGT